MAESFQTWVCDEVLPSIRKQGGYMTVKADETEEELMARAWVVAQVTLARREESLRLLEKENLNLTDEVAEMKPKADYCDIILRSPESLVVTQIAKNYGMSPQEFNKRLRALGIQYKVNGSGCCMRNIKAWAIQTRTQG